jgi:hypothetical protein
MIWQLWDGTTSIDCRKERLLPALLTSSFEPLGEVSHCFAAMSWGNRELSMPLKMRRGRQSNGGIDASVKILCDAFSTAWDWGTPFHPFSNAPTAAAGF